AASAASSASPMSVDAAAASAEVEAASAAAAAASAEAWAASAASMSPAMAALSAASWASFAASAASAAESAACCWLVHAARARPMAIASSALLMVMKYFLVVEFGNAQLRADNMMTTPCRLSSGGASFLVKKSLPFSRHLDGHCRCFAAADAQRSHPALAAPGLQGMHQGDQQAGAAGTDRVAEGDRPPVDVEPVV